MDSERGKGNNSGMLHVKDSSSPEAMLTYKRRRHPEPEEPEMPKKRPHPEPQMQLQTHPKPEPESEQEPQPEPNTGDVAHKVTGTLWESRDIGWKHGIMIDQNRQHWKCKYCHLTRYGGGVSRLKRHLTGDLDVKMCPKVPADVAEKIREHLRKKREKRKKRAEQNGGESVKTMSTSDDSNAEKDPLSVDSEAPIGTETSVLEEVTNQTNQDNQEPTLPRASMLRGVKDIGWDHAVDLDGNKRRWKCNWCSLCRTGGVTTLKAHLTDNSCPNIPKEISKKVLNFIEGKKAARNHSTSTNIKSPFNLKFDEDTVQPSQIQEEGTLAFPDGQQPSRNAMHMQTSEKLTMNDVATGSNQMGAESSGPPVQHCKQSMISTDQQKSTDQQEKQCAREHGKHQVLDNEHQTVEKSIDTDNSQNKEVLKCPPKTRFNTRKHIIVVDETARHWKCRYCSMDVHANKSRLRYHLAGVFRYPKCPNVPTEVHAKARHHILLKKNLNTTKNGHEAPSGSHIFGQSSEELQNKDSSEVLSNYPARLRDTAWEHSLVHDKEKGHWKCKWCSLEGYHGITRLKWHLVGWNNPRHKCPKIPEDAAKKIKDQLISREKLKAIKARPIDGINSFDMPGSSKNSQFDQEHPTIVMQDTSSSEAFDQDNGRSKTFNSLCNTNLPTQKSSNSQQGPHVQPASTNPSNFRTVDHVEAAAVIAPEQTGEIMSQQHPHVQAAPTNPSNFGSVEHVEAAAVIAPQQGLHENGLHGSKRRCEKEAQRSDCWSHCKYILDRLMHSQGIQEGSGILSCIRDALNGHTGFETAGDKVDMDADRTVSSDVNITKCQSVLVDVLKSENFALLCNVLGKTVHQDGENITYFNFGTIASRMKNGDYGREPGLFKDDLNVIWEDLKMAGQDIISLANSLSSLTETSYTRQVRREGGSDNGEENLRGYLVPDVQKDSACNECGKAIKSASVLTCNRCTLAYHSSCIEPPVTSISTGSWHCKNCSTIGDESAGGDMAIACNQPNCLHGNCVCAICEKLEVCIRPECAKTVSQRSVEPIEDLELSNIDVSGSCKICGHPEEVDKRFLICGHVHCPYKYYHIRCLKSQQIASDAQQGKPCWYCPSCLCRVCHSDKDDDQIILCDGCDEAYHLYCTTPRRTSVPKGKWYCSSCCVVRAREGMLEYERRMLKLHRKEDAGLQSMNYAVVDLLLSAAEKLSADEKRGKDRSLSPKLG